MKKYLILIAGSPATGKSYLVNLIEDIFENLLFVTPDEIKEMYADSIGFNNLEEKNKLEIKVWNFYYKILDLYMEAGKQIIVSEYPFSEKQYSKLKSMSEENDYKVITVRLVTDFEELWERRYKRDREPSRHLSHLVSSYHYGDTLENRSSADNHITKEEFKEIIEQRQYDKFVLGEILEVDTTDFTKVDYEEIKNFLISNINL